MKGKTMHTKRLAQWAAAAVLAGSAAVISAGPAHASTVCAPLATVADHSYVSPIHSGQALDAIGWGGSGSRAAACTGAVVNDDIKTFTYAKAGVAADFTPVATTGGTYQLVYTPGNMVSTTQPLCVSTVLDQLGAYSRLRPCSGVAVTVDAVTGNATLAAGAGNQWQDFTLSPTGDGFFQIEASTEPAPGPYSLNIKGYGGSGTQVISWNVMSPSCAASTPPCAENQIFEKLAAA